MSIQDYQKTRELIEAAGGGDFEGVKSDALVTKAEAALGVKLPPSYRRFLLELGCGDFNAVEVFGIINDSFDKPAVPNGIWLTLKERRSIDLDPAYVIIGEGGDGAYYALDTRHVDAEGESPIVRLSVDAKYSEKIEDSFGSCFLNAVRAVI